MRITYTMQAPLSHIGETASTGAYFQTVLTANGRVPVVTGNSIRGQLRNCIASHLLDTIGAKVNKEVFHILFSGGNINESMRDDLERARQVRAHFPAVSLMGAALGDMIMDGSVRFGFAYPVCAETHDITGVNGMLSWHEMIDEIEFTRMDDVKNDLLTKYLTDADEEAKGTARQQMRYSVQYMAAGTQFVEQVSFLPSVTDLELGAFNAGFKRWLNEPFFGGMSAKGFGKFETDYVPDEGLIAEYEEFIRSEGNKYLYLLESKGGKKSGKGSNKAAENNGSSI